MKQKLARIDAQSKQLLMEKFNALDICASNIIGFDVMGSKSVLWYRTPLPEKKPVTKKKGKK